MFWNLWKHFGLIIECCCDFHQSGFHCVFKQISDLKKVYDIFVSDAVEIDVRKSAAEQLAVIMQGMSTGYFSSAIL